MKKIARIIFLSIFISYMIANIGCKSRTDFSPYADGTYVSGEEHSHSHDHDDNDDDDDHE